MQQALRREVVRHGATHWTLPLPDGPGKALSLTLRPLRESIPIYLAAVGPRNLALAGEIADGWLGIFFAPEHAELSLEPIRTARAAAGRGTDDDPLTGFDVCPTVPLSVGDDLEAAAAPLRAYTALYVGGMGTRQQNFYNALVRRMGYEEAAQNVQDLYLDRRHRDAMAAVPLDLIEATCLVGPAAKVRERVQAYAEAGVSTLTVSPAQGPLPARIAMLRTLIEAVETVGVAS